MFIASSMYTVLSEQFIVSLVGTIEAIQLFRSQSPLAHVIPCTETCLSDVFYRWSEPFVT